MNLEIITPDKTIFEGEVNLVQLPGIDGSFELLNNHAPMISALKSAELNNVLGFNNIYGYTYNNTPNNSGIYEAKPVTPPSKRMAVLLISFLL